jgi:hypothetical protein
MTSARRQHTLTMMNGVNTSMRIVAKRTCTGYVWAYGGLDEFNATLDTAEVRVATTASWHTAPYRMYAAERAFAAVSTSVPANL